MTNDLYPKWREALISGAANSGLNGTVKVALATFEGFPEEQNLCATMGIVSGSPHNSRTT